MSEKVYATVYYYNDGFELNYEKGDVGMTLPLSKKALKDLRADIDEALTKEKSK